MGFLLVVDEEWGAETVDVLTGVVPVGPVGADLVADGDFVGEGGALRDGAEGRHGSVTLRGFGKVVKIARTIE